jgi:hypothetical protein
MPCCHSGLSSDQAESANIFGQIEKWSKIDAPARVDAYKPSENKVVLSNGKEYTYKALVLSPGFDHSDKHVEGLPEMRQTPESENVYVH